MDIAVFAEASPLLTVEVDRNFLLCGEQFCSDPKSETTLDWIFPFPGGVNVLRSWLPQCAICKEPVTLEESKTDERGLAVHETCYTWTVKLKTPKAHRQIGGSTRRSFVCPLTIILTTADLMKVRMPLNSGSSDSFHVSGVMRVLVIAGLCILTGSARNAIASETATWRDPSPHHITFVTVDNGVKLEVLDWGGSGRAVVLLAGYQTAHEYDDIASKLSAFCHVYGITRRGFGASSRPDSGYTAQRSAEDVLQVLDALKLDHPVLAGHSFGGEDLFTIGAQHPALVAGLVFLDSADDPTLPSSAYGVAEVDTKRLPASMTTPEPQPDNSSFQAFRESQLKAHGVMDARGGTTPALSRQLRRKYRRGFHSEVGAGRDIRRDSKTEILEYPCPGACHPCRSTPAGSAVQEVPTKNSR